MVQKEVAAQLRNTDRSRTPLLNKGGRGGKGRQQLAAPQQLALPGPAASSSAADTILEVKEKAKGRNKRNRVGKRPLAGRVWQLRDLLPDVQSMLHGNQGNGICFAFQDGLSELGPSCNRQHVCIGCGSARRHGRCLQSRLAALASASPRKPSDGDNAVATAPLHLPSVTSCKTHGRILFVAAHDCHETDFWEPTDDTWPQQEDSALELAYFDLSRKRKHFEILMFLQHVSAGFFYRGAQQFIEPAPTRNEG